MAFRPSFVGRGRQSCPTRKHRAHPSLDTTQNRAVPFHPATGTSWLEVNPAAVRTDGGPGSRYLACHGYGSGTLVRSNSLGAIAYLGGFVCCDDFGLFEDELGGGGFFVGWVSVAEEESFDGGAEFGSDLFFDVPVGFGVSAHYFD